MKRGCSSAVTLKEQRNIKNAILNPPFHMNFIVVVVVLVVIDSLLTLGCTLKFYELCSYAASFTYCAILLFHFRPKQIFIPLYTLILSNRIKQSTFNDDAEKKKRRQMHKMHSMNFTNHFEQQQHHRKF